MMPGLGWYSLSVPGQIEIRQSSITVLNPFVSSFERPRRSCLIAPSPRTVNLLILKGDQVGSERGGRLSLNFC